jgi:hypothetical protein
MSNGDDRYRSRKFLLAVASFVVVTTFAGFGLIHLAADAGDVALVLGAWAGSDATILGMYSHWNVKEKE